MGYLQTRKEFILNALHPDDKHFHRPFEVVANVFIYLKKECSSFYSSTSYWIDGR